MLTSIADAPPCVASPSAADLALRYVGLLLEDDRERETSDEVVHPTFDPPMDLGGFFDPPLDDETVPSRLSIDTAAVVVLLAAQLASAPGAMSALSHGAGIVVIQLESDDLADQFERVLKICIFGRGTRMLDASRKSELRSSTRIAGRKAVIIACDVGKSEIAHLRDQATIAMSLAIPICAISIDPPRAVPSLIRANSDFTLGRGTWTNDLVAILLEAVTGTSVEVPNEAWISSITMEDLRISVSAARGGLQSLDRLRHVVERRTVVSTDVPHLRDLAGYGRAQEIGLSLIRDLSDYRDGKIGWNAVERGMVLVGPPGVGKSLYARAFARSAELPLVIASLAGWQSSGGGYLGDTIKAMRSSFTAAKAVVPSILFIDELDSIGSREAFDDRNRDYSSQVLNALLEELDGACARTGVFVLGATNLIHRIDPAIVRPGRFDRIVAIDLPDTGDLAEILRTCLGADLPGVDIMPCALAGRGGAGADAAAWVRMARGTARRAGRTMIVDDLLDAIRADRKPMPDDVRARVAIHEAGHACAAAALGIGIVDALTIHDDGGQVAIAPSDGALTRDRAVRELILLLAGRAAEIVAIGSPSAGAGGTPGSDLARATRLALAVETGWGLGTAGPMWFADPASAASVTSSLMTYGAPVRHLLRHAEEEAARLIRENRHLVNHLSERLLSAGYLEAGEALEIIGEIAAFEVMPVPDRTISVSAPVERGTSR